MYADRFSGCEPGMSQIINWYTTCAVDGTSLWGPSLLVFHSESFDPCFGAAFGPPTTPTYTNDDANGTFGFDIAPNGTLWAAVHDTRTSIRVRMSANGGATWMDSGPLNNLGTFGGTDVGQPWLAVDLAGNVGVTYYQTTSAAGTQLQRQIAVRDASAGIWSAPTVISAAFAPSFTAAAGSVGAIGEFQGITLVDPAQFIGGNSFFAVWTETDPANTNRYRISGARIGVSP